jgi:hypothetical protein
MRRLPIIVIMALVLSFVVATALVGCKSSTQASASDNSKAEPNESETSKKEAKVHSAMSAAPTSIAKDARIVDYPQKAGQPLIKRGEEWVSTPPHIMLIVPGKLDKTFFSTDHHSGEPWIMYAGTPYEHVMIPVEEEIN